MNPNIPFDISCTLELHPSGCIVAKIGCLGETTKWSSQFPEVALAGALSLLANDHVFRSILDGLAEERWGKLDRRGRRRP